MNPDTLKRVRAEAEAYAKTETACAEYAVLDSERLERALCDAFLAGYTARCAEDLTP